MNKAPNPISFFNTYIDPSAERRVVDVLRSTFLSEGKIVKQFENELERTLGLANPVAVNSCTSALHLSLVLAGVSAGDEVILPAQTFVATGTTIVQQGAIPIFADIHYKTGNISPDEIEKKITSKTKAIIAVHWAGLPADMDEISLIARKHNLVVIEDAAHALGATYKKRPVGTISPLTCFSFQAIKHVTTGDGGAISISDSKLSDGAYSKRWFGIDRTDSSPSELGERDYDITELGFKYHLNDYSAALGLANLESFPKRLKERRSLAARYRDGLLNVPGIILFENPQDRESACWLFGFHVERRSDFIKMMKAHGIPTSIVHRGIDHNTIFGGIQNELINQRRFDETQIHIPIHDAINEEAENYIIETIKNGW